MAVNILVECPSLIASVRVGVLDSLKELCDQKICDVSFIKTIDIKSKDIVWADIVICVRGCERSTLEIIRTAKRFGRFIIYFLDDDLLNIPDDVSCSEFFGRDDIKQNIKDILKLSDVLWYVNPLIGEIYGEYTDGRRVLTKVCTEPVEDIDISAGTDKFNILYAGSVDHTDLLNKYIVPAAYNIMNKYKEKVTFTFVGANPDIDRKKYPSVRCLKFFDNYDKYSSFIKEGHFDVGLAVVRTSRFYQCKYYNKFIEYTKHGITGIYTDSLPYTAIVKDGISGILTENSVDAWTEAIDRAVSDRELTQRCIINAKELLIQDFDSDSVTAKLRETIPELLDYKAPKVKKKEIRLPDPFIGWVIERIKYYYKKYFLLCLLIIPVKAVKVLFIRIYKGCESLVQKIFFRDI